ncbi:ATP-binding cassette protein [Spraguea lophii 42_110]|uniref:ATP-binding cassette protein n=1 Tax=Spraguea lophii (strain 42_110) TaxID=1358809 RepID=S7XK62_SPRLO|nr:ATP-binding cassette protein [Spraguea lophii 42_110]
MNNGVGSYEEESHNKLHQEIIDEYISVIKEFPFSSQDEINEFPYKELIPNLKVRINKYEPVEFNKKGKEESKIENNNVIKSSIDKVTDYVLEESSSSFHNCMYCEEENCDCIKTKDSLICVEDIRIEVKNRILMKDINLKFDGRYGLVGSNGKGKSLLLKEIAKRVRGVVLLNQDIRLNSKKTVEEKLIKDYNREEAFRILRGLGFTQDMITVPIKNFSGGWIKKVYIAKALLTNYNLLLLDEPTNFLDIPSITWLEREIIKIKNVVIVSHDREFLNNTVNKILHLENKKIEEYKGGYKNFKEQYSRRREERAKEIKKQNEEREHLKSFIDRFRFNAKRAPQVQSRIKILEKLPKLEPYKDEIKIKFKFQSDDIKGRIIEFKNYNFRYKDKIIFKDLNICLRGGKKMLIVGKNGTGKSTFLKMILNLINGIGNDKNEFSGGKDDNIKFINNKLKVGYFAQYHNDQLDMEERVLPCVMKNKIEEEDARSLLSTFNLSLDYQKIRNISGGEKTKLNFALISITNPNLLLLDEPTNHLDVESIDALKEALKEFKGTLICISHDLTFIKDLFDEIYICENNTLKLYNKGIDEYKKSLNFQ